MNTLEEGLEDLRCGKCVIVVDDENRENEGDLVIPGAFVTSEIINFMAHNACGLICTPMEESRLSELNIQPMVSKNTDNHETAFTVSVDSVETTTGISAFDRAKTIMALTNPVSKPNDFRRPGHVFPLAAKAGGVLERAGHTEAAIDLSKIVFSSGVPKNAPSGVQLPKNHSGVICEIMGSDGKMMRLNELEKFGQYHNLKIISVKQIIEYRLSKETQIVKEVETVLPTDFGVFKMYGYKEKRTSLEHVALVMGDISSGKNVLCRLHSECLTGDALGSRRCDCGEQYRRSLQMIAEEGRGVLVYLRQEGRGIGLLNKLKAYSLQDKGADTVEANLALGFKSDERNYCVGAQILSNLGIHGVRLITNNPLKIEGLKAFEKTEYEVNVEERIPIVMKANKYDKFYLETKERRMGHKLNCWKN